jgi:phage terminase large subunit-like protein
VSRAALGHALLRLRRDPLRKYRPGPTQARFIKAVLTAAARVLLLRAPNQTGKTTVGAYLLWMLCRRDVVTGRVLCKTKDQSLVIQRKIAEMMPPDALAPGCRWDPDRGFRIGMKNALRAANGSYVDFVTTEQGSIAVASATLDFVWVDEPTKATIFAECVARVTATGGLVFTTLTPIGAPLQYLRDAVDDGSVLEFHYGLTVEECPWLSQGRIDETVAMCLPAERPQRTGGEWDGVTPDRFYGAWDDSMILPEDFSLGRDDGGMYWFGLGIDHGEGVARQDATLVAVNLDSGNVYLWDEWVSEGKTDSARDAMGILDMLRARDLDVGAIDEARGDHNSAGKAEAGMLVNQLLEQEIRKLLGLPSYADPPLRIRNARKGPGSVLAGCALIHRAMARGEFWVHPRCKSKIAHYRHWKGPRDGSAENKKLSHGGDGARYILRGPLDKRERLLQRGQVVYS